ncbi:MULTISPECIES: hypothetical protein [unclassified Mesorhizobium]|uniref:hypothetical protein n=1 Tax=unclassified Mesorhizobium TaxID=325217 RepID=UPI0012E33E75|nr:MULTISPECIES: hypothetical protein [unclassified Mesorhizobium]
MKFVLAAALTLSLTTIASAQDYLGSSLQSESFGRQLERSQGNAGVNRPKYRKHHQTAQPSQAQMNEVMRALSQNTSVACNAKAEQARTDGSSALLIALARKQVAAHADSARSELLVHHR